MPTTTNYGWTTPADTDLVKDGASAIRTLGTAIDTTVFTNAGAAINKTIVDAKGDLIAATGADAVIRVAVGTNGQYLKADSTASGGVSWDTLPSSGGMTLINTGGTTLSGASVTIGSIPGTYKNLQLIVRNYKPATDNALLLARINNDSTANRYYYNSAVAATNVSFNEDGGVLSYNQDNSVSDAILVANYYDYANTTTWKIWDSLSFNHNATTSTNINYIRWNGVFNQTGAITSLVLYANSGNLTSGTAYLYGVS